MKIEGAICFITGGGSGLGLAIVNHLHSRGARVIAVDIDSDAIGGLPQGIDGYIMDVTDVSSVKGVVDDVFVRFGRIDVLVNNAGVIFSKPMVNLSQPSNLMHDYDSFRSSVTSNMDSVFIVTSAIVEKMVWRRTRGAVINISSISACGNAGQTAYSAAKAGVNAMTVTWSKELGKLGIRCNAVAPGFFDTTSTNHSLAPEIKTHIQRNTPLQRFGDKEEIARAISFVIENDYMNGAVLNIDGGLRL